MVDYDRQQTVIDGRLCQAVGNGSDNICFT